MQNNEKPKNGTNAKCPDENAIFLGLPEKMDETVR